MTKIKCKCRLGKKMVSKSIEAFTYAIETYNKPTITYRVETFSYLICNAWELLLKAYWMETKGRKSIYFPDNPNRSLSLERIVKETFTNENDPVRKNLLEIIELRNTSTHFITEDYETLYAPLFQACVMNYIDKLDEYFDVNIYEIIKYPFLTISTYSEVITPESFKKRYGKELFERYIQKLTTIEQLTASPNEKLAITMNIDFSLVKDPSKADMTMSLSKEANANVAIIKETRDVNKNFPYNQKRAMIALNDRLEKHKIPVHINSYQFQMLCIYFGLYDDNTMCYHVQIDTSPRKIFSNKLIDFLFQEISKDHNIAAHIKEKIKKASPRSKGF